MTFYNNCTSEVNIILCEEIDNHECMSPLTHPSKSWDTPTATKILLLGLNLRMNNWSGQCYDGASIIIRGVGSRGAPGAGAPPLS